MHLRYYFFATIALLISPHVASAIVTSDAPGTHIITPGTTALGLNLDGVAMIGGLIVGEPISFCSGALISDQHVLCAAHCLDPDRDGQLESLLAPFGVADRVMFETAGGLVSIEYDIAAVQVPTDWPELESDIAIITLQQNAPPSVPRYKLYGGADEVGRRAVLTGYGDTGHGSTGAMFDFNAPPTRRAGINRIDEVFEDPGIAILSADFDSGLPENNSHALVDIESDLGFGADEVGLAPGDSGGPMFINGAIAGVSLAAAQLILGDINDDADGSWGELNLFTRVSAYRQFIITATGGKAIFVPEPSPIVIIFVNTTIIAVSSGRRRLFHRHHRSLLARS